MAMRRSISAKDPLEEEEKLQVDSSLTSHFTHSITLFSRAGVEPVVREEQATSMDRPMERKLEPAAVRGTGRDVSRSTRAVTSSSVNLW